MELYPLKFKPLFKYRIWGGDKLKRQLNKPIEEESTGESWEISAVDGDQTMVASGNLKGRSLKQLIKEYKEGFLGEKPYAHFGEEFPLLIKFIDAKTPLSIQVHPNDQYAKEHHNSFGKNEMWYVMQADEKAEIIVGFEKEVSKNEFRESLQSAEVLKALNTEYTQKGDTFHIPTGRIHAIGAGVLLAEIQQTSDVTYRVYDYDRVDTKTGAKRELHVEQAIEVIDFTKQENYKTDYAKNINQSNELVHTQYFTTNFLPIKGELFKDYTETDSFVILICVEGDAELIHEGDSYTLKKGETILLPAVISTIVLRSEGADILEVSI